MITARNLLRFLEVFIIDSASPLRLVLKIVT